MLDRTTRPASLAIAAAAAIAAGAACAQTSPDAPPRQEPSQEIRADGNGRYAMTPSPGGFLRLDTRTGAVSYCTTSKDIPQCRLAPDERAALEQEIDRLAKQNADLQKRVAALPPRPAISLPDKKDMDRALDFAEDFMRRMMRIVRPDTPPDRT